jgi:hypothetical protein
LTRNNKSTASPTFDKNLSSSYDPDEDVVCATIGSWLDYELITKPDHTYQMFTIFLIGFVLLISSFFISDEDPLLAATYL